jgi:hypothetical protein
MSVYFSNLPEYTGNTYNGYVIWNDSGETTTYKTKETNSFVKRLEIKDLAETNTINANVKSALVVGYSNTISSAASNKHYFVLGHNNVINAVVGGAPYAITIGNNVTVSSFGGICIGAFSSVGGERAFRWGNNGNSNGIESFSWGEQVNVAGVRSFGFGAFNTITPANSYSFGSNNDITTSIQLQGIFGGENNLISATGADGHNFIFGSEASTISGTSQFVSLIGLSGFTSPTENDTTYTQNHKSLGQSYNGYFDNGSGDTFTIDWNNGNSQKVFMTGDTSLTFTNVKSGGQYRLQIVNGGTHSITATTASGFTILCEGGVVPNITNNGVDLCVLEGMGTDLLVRHFADFAAP